MQRGRCRQSKSLDRFGDRVHTVRRIRAVRIRVINQHAKVATAIAIAASATYATRDDSGISWRLCERGTGHSSWSSVDGTIKFNRRRLRAKPLENIVIEQVEHALHAGDPR